MESVNIPLQMTIENMSTICSNWNTDCLLEKLYIVSRICFRLNLSHGSLQTKMGQKRSEFRLVENS